MRTVQATVDADGQVHLDEAIVLHGPVRALVTILDTDVSGTAALNEPALLAEKALAEGWTGKDANEAWAHLRELPDLGDER